MSKQSLYVACSRSTKASGPYLIGSFIPPLPPKKIGKIIEEMQRLRRDPKFQILQEPKKEVEIIFQNIHGSRLI